MSDDVSDKVSIIDSLFGGWENLQKTIQENLSVAISAIEEQRKIAGDRLGWLFDERIEFLNEFVGTEISPYRLCMLSFDANAKLSALLGIDTSGLGDLALGELFSDVLVEMQDVFEKRDL